ncbi:hypothetical protein B0O99DRAFT_617709 [Bisporella sp. PMI_857]|nr:hypothetical protein B0O99DRAFT_617709 [Bisporella sp. PMI_857]
MLRGIIPVLPMPSQTTLGKPQNTIKQILPKHRSQILPISFFLHREPQNISPTPDTIRGIIVIGRPELSKGTPRRCGHSPEVLYMNKRYRRALAPFDPRDPNPAGRAWRDPPPRFIHRPKVEGVGGS